MHFDKKRWTKSQRDLMDLALEEPDRKGLNLNVVLAQRYSGLSSAVKFLDRQRAEKVLPVHASTFSAWDAIVSLSDRTGTGTGFGYAGSLRRALAALTMEGTRPVTLILGDAEFMNPREISFLLKLLDSACDLNSCHVRAVMLFQPVTKFHHKKNIWENAWPVMPEIIKERRKNYNRMVFEFSAEGLDELTGLKEIREKLETPIGKPILKAA